MQELEIDIRPVDWLSCGTTGKPGERTFFVQARGGTILTTLLLEKVQLDALAVGLEEFLEDIERRNTDLAKTNPEYDPAEMELILPLDPLYRVGEVGLAYDEADDLVILLLREIMTTQASEEDLRAVRLWLTRSQSLVFSTWAKVVVSRGRKACPQCGEPLDPSGHLCPKKNGHRK